MPSPGRPTPARPLISLSDPPPAALERATMMSLQRVPPKLRGVLGGVMTAGPVECGSDKKPSGEHAAMQLLLGQFSRPLPSRGHHG